MALAQAVVPQPVLEAASSYSSASYTSSATTVETQGNKTESSSPLSRPNPPLFDTSSLLGGQLAALAAAAAGGAVDTVKGLLPGGIPDPLFPFGFPFGAPLTGTAFGSSSGIALSLELLAILALLYTLSRRGTSSVSPREVFRLVSSPRLVTELPG
jgi:hypothetical protein